MSAPVLEPLRWTDAVTLASPHPYVLVTTVDAAGRPNIIGIGWFTIASWKPPLVVISVAPTRHSFKNLLAVPEFVMNFPPPDLARAAWRCGTTSGAERDKFLENGLTALPSQHVRPPTIAGSTMAWECRVTGGLDTGDHRLFVGEVVHTRGDMGAKAHLYSLHYRSLVAVDPEDGTLRLASPEAE